MARSTVAMNGSLRFFDAVQIADPGDNGFWTSTWLLHCVGDVVDVAGTTNAPLAAYICRPLRSLSSPLGIAYPLRVNLCSLKYVKPQQSSIADVVLLLKYRSAQGQANLRFYKESNVWQGCSNCHTLG